MISLSMHLLTFAMQGHSPLEYWLEISCVLTFLLPVLMLNCNDYDALQIVISSTAVLHMSTKYIKMDKIVECSFIVLDAVFKKLD